MKRLVFLLCLLLSVPAFCQWVRKVDVQKPGTLGACLTRQDIDTCTSLCIMGHINSADIKVLREMAGADGHGRLATLDLTDAKIVTCEEPYLVIRKAEESVLPTIKSVTVNADSPNRTLRWTVIRPEPIPFKAQSGELRSVRYVLAGDDERDVPNADSPDLSLWKKVAKVKSKGHRVSAGKDGHYTYCAFTHKKLFCSDMFYRCPNLQLVVVPQRGRMSEDVVISKNHVKYKGNIQPRYIYMSEYPCPIAR